MTKITVNEKNQIIWEYGAAWLPQRGCAHCSCIGPTCCVCEKVKVKNFSKALLEREKYELSNN